MGLPRYLKNKIKNNDYDLLEITAYSFGGIHLDFNSITIQRSYTNYLQSKYINRDQLLTTSIFEKILKKYKINIIKFGLRQKYKVETFKNNDIEEWLYDKDDIDWHCYWEKRNGKWTSIYTVLKVNHYFLIEQQN